jgi:hypothetical protein
MENTKDVREKFPFNFTKHDNIEHVKSYPVTSRFNNKDLELIKKYAKLKKRRVNHVVAEITKAFIEKWDA